MSAAGKVCKRYSRAALPLSAACAYGLSGRMRRLAVRFSPQIASKIGCFLTFLSEACSRLAAELRLAGVEQRRQSVREHVSGRNGKKQHDFFTDLRGKAYSQPPHPPWQAICAGSGEGQGRPLARYVPLRLKPSESVPRKRTYGARRIS